MVQPYIAVISIATISTVSRASGTQVKPIMPSSVKTMIVRNAPIM